MTLYRKLPRLALTRTWLPAWFVAIWRALRRLFCALDWAEEGLILSLFEKADRKLRKMAPVVSASPELRQDLNKEHPLFLRKFRPLPSHFLQYFRRPPLTSIATWKPSRAAILEMGRHKVTSKVAKFAVPSTESWNRRSSIWRVSKQWRLSAKRNW